MPNVNDLKKSRFLAIKDVEPPVTVTITKYEKINVALETQEPDERWCLYFRELAKPLALNVTNGMLLKAITGSDDFDNWIGKKVVLFNDESVMFAGEFTGGIRIRAIQTTATGGQSNPDYVGDDPSPPPTDDDIPY